MNKKVFYMPGEELTEEEKKIASETLKRQQEKTQKELADRAEADTQKKSSVDFMTVNFEPFEDRILVYPDPVETITKGGLYKPEEATKKMKPVIGTIVKVGPGKPNFKITIIPGDRISYGNYAGTPFQLNGIDYLIMRFADCYGKVS